MGWIRKNFIILIFSAIIYAVYLFTHPITPPPHHDVLGVNTNLLLYEQPKDGRQFLVDALDQSQKEIDVEMYLLSDKTIITALEDAKNRGVAVSVLLEQHPFGGGNLNQKTYQELASKGISVKWTNPAFSLTHEKAVVIDSQKVFILSQNLTASSFEKNREYDVEDFNQDDVSGVKAIFLADWNRTSIIPTDVHLVVSPVSARPAVEQLITTSQKELDIETEVIDDTKVVGDLCSKAGTVAIRILVPDISQVAANAKQLSALQQCGVSTKTLKKPYIHAKLILSDAKAYVGSVNLTTQSLDENREVGIVITQPDILSTLSQDFETDWSAGQSYP